jgi:hypothetical protein
VKPPLEETVATFASQSGLDPEAARAMLLSGLAKPQTLHLAVELILKNDPETVHARILQAVKGAGLNSALQNITWAELSSALAVYRCVGWDRKWKRMRKGLTQQSGNLRRIELNNPGWDEVSWLRHNASRARRAGDRVPPPSAWDALPRIGGLTVSEHCALLKRLKQVSPFDALVGRMLPKLYEGLTGKPTRTGRDAYNNRYTGEFLRFAEIVLREAGILDDRTGRPYSDASIARSVTKLRKTLRAN